MQALLPRGIEIISYHLSVHEHTELQPILDVLDSLTFISSFHFLAIVAADHNLPDYSQINFIRTKSFDCESLIKLFYQLNIKFFQSHLYLVFQGTSEVIEKIILTSQELSI